MGVNIDEARALLGLRRDGFAGDDILCLGRPEIFGSAGDFARLSQEFGLGWASEDCRDIAEQRYADAFLKRAGFRTIRSLDASAYEGADIVHDLNAPLPDELKGKARFIYDGGLIEHVFDVAQAMRNVIDLLDVGGVLLMSSPANGQCGHGFYQFSPELFFRLFEANGFDQIAVYLVCLNKPSRWFRATDPRAVKRRIQFSTSEPLQMLLVARKAQAKGEFVIPQQSDYADAQWSESLEGATAQRDEWNSPRAKLRAFVRDRLVTPAAVTLRHMFGIGAPAGMWRRAHFQPFDPATARIAGE